MSDLNGPGWEARGTVSVVIPTLGGPSLARTIEYLNRGTVVPSEVLVCIPQEDAFRAETLSFYNVKIVRTSCRGQVAQRAIGFEQASEDLVLQLDDDILVSSTCVERLVACIERFHDVAVGPKLYDINTRQYRSFMIPSGTNASWFERLLFWAINGSRGYEPGRIGRAGVCMGVPAEPDDWMDLEWLPGGCVLHRRANLVLSDFYPFKGKAYAEDLFHSYLLKQKGVRLMRCGAATCEVDFTSNFRFDPLGLVNSYRAYARALTKLIRDFGGSRSRLYLYLFLSVLGKGARKLFRAGAGS